MSSIWLLVHLSSTWRRRRREKGEDKEEGEGQSCSYCCRYYYYYHCYYLHQNHHCSCSSSPSFLKVGLTTNSTVAGVALGWAMMAGVVEAGAPLEGHLVAGEVRPVQGGAARRPATRQYITDHLSLLLLSLLVHRGMRSLCCEGAPEGVVAEGHGRGGGRPGGAVEGW